MNDRMNGTATAKEDRFADAFAHAAIGMALVAPDGRFIEVNPAMCATTGYTREELLAMDFQAITHPDDLATDLDHVRCLLAGEGDSFRMAKRYLHKQGGTIWIQLAASLVRAEDGTPRYFVAQVQDITAEKRIDEERERLLAILDTTPDMVSTAHPDSRIIYLNPAGRKMLGISPDEDVTQHRIADYHSEASMRLIQDQLIPAINAFGHWQGENTLKSRTGYEIPVMQSATCHRDAQGRPQYYSTVMRDMTYQRYLENEWNKSRDLFRAMFDQAAVGMAVGSPAERFLETNEALQKMLGYTAAELKAMTADDATNPADIDMAHAAQRKMLAGEADFAQFEKRFRHKSGREIWVRANAMLMRDRPGAPPYVVTIYEDFTDRKRFEQTIELMGRRHELILNAAGWGIMVADTAGKLTFVNPAAAATLGAGVESLLGSPIREFHRADRDGKPHTDETCLIYASLKDGLSRRNDADLLWRKNGERFPAEYAITPLVDEGRIDGVVVAFMEITGQ